MRFAYPDGVKQGHYEDVRHDFTHSDGIRDNLLGKSLVGTAVANMAYPDGVKQGHYEDATHDFTKALDLVPRSVAALMGRAEALRLLGRYDEAFADARRALGFEPQNIGIMILQAKIYMSAGQVRSLSERMFPEPCWFLFFLFLIVLLFGLILSSSWRRRLGFWSTVCKSWGTMWRAT